MNDFPGMPSDTDAAPSSEERNWALVAHLGIFASVIVGPLNFLVPLVIYIVWKDRSGFVAEEAKEALNFQLTMLLMGCVAALLVFTIIGMIVGIPILLVIGVMGIVLPILAAIRVGEGGSYRYPLTIRLVP
ncbi:MAG: DUF4870 domain-containing protein [Planctomycetes bacterium]|nr:DUF4870 domain-containing protein [Planctomycetota bacterium]MCB9904055.1 DUF4870 domain-containing protein [Planctomycetota bacterium]